MRAHQLDGNGLIINTVVVADLSVLPNLIDAAIGGGIGDSVIDGVLVPKTEGINAVKEQRRASILQTIDSIERQYLANRGAREMDIEILRREAAQKSQETGVPVEDILSASPYYTKLILVDNQCRALRAELAAI
jgi:hypothetical protein